MDKRCALGRKDSETVYTDYIVNDEYLYYVIYFNRFFSKNDSRLTFIYLRSYGYYVSKVESGILIICP